MHSPAERASNTAAPLAADAIERMRDSIAAGAPLREILAQLTAAVEAASGGRTVASILLLDTEGLLRNGASPSLPGDYLAAIDRIAPDPAVGTCAAAAATGEVVFTPDFRQDEKWAELRHLPMAIGFAGAWSMPIKGDDGRVLGTFGSYFREPRLPTEEEVRLVGQLAAIAAAAIAAAG